MGAPIREELVLADSFSQTFRNFDAAANAAINVAEEFQKTLNEFSEGFLDGLVNSLQDSRDELGRMASEADDVKDAYKGVEEIIRKTTGGIDDNTDAQDKFNESVRRSEKSAGNLMGTISKIAGAIGVVKLAENFIETSDEMAQITAKLNLINDGFMTTEQLQTAIYNSAQRTRSSYLDTANLVARIGMNTGGTFKSNSEIVKFAENLNKSFKIAGASAQEQSSVILQLSQALAGGLLRGQEFNAVMSGAPNIIKNIADYMGVTVGEMRDLAAEGQITSDIIREAMLEATDDINAKFETLPRTFGDVMTTAKNQITTSLGETFDDWINAINADEMQQKIDRITDAISDLAVVGGDALVGIAENWDAIITAIEFAAGSVASFKILNLTVAAEVGSAWEGALAPLLKIAGILGALGVLVIKTEESEARYDAGVGIDPKAKELFEQDENELEKAGYIIGDAILPESATDWYKDWWTSRHGERAEWKMQGKDEINKLKANQKADWYAEYYTPDNNVNAIEERLRVADKAAWYQAYYSKEPEFKYAENRAAWADKANWYEQYYGGKTAEIAENLKNGVDTRVKNEVKLADEDLKIFRDIAENRYIANVSLETLAPSVSVNVENNGQNLSEDDIATAVTRAIETQISERTAISHG